MYSFVRGRASFLLLGDLVFFVSALIVTLFLRYQTLPASATIQQHLAPFMLLFVIWIAVFFIAGLYDRHITFSRKQLPARILRVQGVNTVIAALFFFLFPADIAPKTNLVIYLVVSSILISLWRLYIFPLLTRGAQMHIVLVGSGSEIQSITNIFSASPYFQNVHTHVIDTVGVADTDELRQRYKSFLEEQQPDMIVADMNNPLVRGMEDVFFDTVFQKEEVLFYDLPRMYEELHHRIPPSLIRESWLLENISARSPHYAYDLTKRAIDIVGSIMLLVPFAVLLPFIAVAIWLEDRGSIFYKTERVGQFGKVIILLKLRTKNGNDTGAEALKSTLVDTRVGIFLRKTRVDELPQLLNVLRGDLSFIGPRPEIPTLAEVYAREVPHYQVRHRIKPGLSGWAQISNYDAPRGGVDVPRTIAKLSFDLYYLKRRSLLLDIEIALKTVNTLLLRTGT